MWVSVLVLYCLILPADNLLSHTHIYAGRLLAIGNMTGNQKIIEAGGGMGLATAAAAFYTGAAALLTPDLSHFPLPVGLLGQR